MNKLQLLFIGILIFSACKQNTSRETSGVVLNNLSQADTLCFERYSGLENRDTATVSLIVEGDLFRGKYENYPFEKDARKGVISGTINEQIFSGMWIYVQEGITDSINVEFKMINDTLLQKQTSYSPESGYEFLADSAQFNLKYNQVNCR